MGASTAGDVTARSVGCSSASISSSMPTGGSRRTSGASTPRRSAPVGRPPARVARRGKNVPGEPADHALGRSRGGFGTKLHLLVDGGGVPLAALLTPGEAHESRQVEPLLRRVHLPRRRGGRPRTRPHALPETRATAIAPCGATCAGGGSAR